MFESKKINVLNHGHLFLSKLKKLPQFAAFARQTTITCFDSKLEKNINYITM